MQYSLCRAETGNLPYEAQPGAKYDADKDSSRDLIETLEWRCIHAENPMINPANSASQWLRSRLQNALQKGNEQTDSSTLKGRS